MRRFRKTPSASMAVAFIALLAALGGTAVALPGTNSVTANDIRAGAVRSSEIRNNSVFGRDIRNNSVRGADIRNGTIAGRDVRNNSLGGADINEGTLSAVPRALTASQADNASTAGLANFAGHSGTVNGFQVSPQVRAADDQNVTILSGGGFSIVLRCDSDGDAGDTRIDIVNNSAGDDSHMDDNVFGFESDDFDEGESFELSSDVGPDSIENSAYSAIGANGSAIHGQTAVVDTPSFPGAPDCIGSATLLGA